MIDFTEFVDPYVRREVVAMPPAVSVESVKRDFNLKKVVKMCSNENPFGVSPKALDAMKDELANVCFYADPEPENALRDKIAGQIGVEPGNVLITCGAAYALYFIGDVFLRPGDEGILCSPTYPPYYSFIQKNGATVVDVPMTEKLEYDFDGILDAITDKTRVIFICNPNNPTGYTVYRDKLMGFIDKVPENVIVVMDEAYVQFTHEPEALTMVPAISSHKNVVVVQTFSKLYGLAGIRVGYAVAAPEIISFMKKEAIVRTLTITAVKGAFAAMDDKEFARKTIENNREGREYLTKELSAMGYKVYPSESNFVYVDFREDPRLTTKKLLPHGIIIRGDFPCVRLSIGTKEENEMVVRALKEVLPA